MPYDQPEGMPKDMEELDFLVARAYSQGIETGQRVGRSDAVAAMKKFWEKCFNLSKGRRRRADPDDPKTAAILEIYEKFNEKLEDESLWQ
jgi:hypothetical protein